MVAYPEIPAAASGHSYGEAHWAVVAAFSSYASICGDIFISWGPPILTLWGHGQSKSLFFGFPAKALISLLMLCATLNDSATEEVSRSPSPQVAVIIAG